MLPMTSSTIKVTLTLSAIIFVVRAAEVPGQKCYKQVCQNLNCVDQSDFDIEECSTTFGANATKCISADIRLGNSYVDIHKGCVKDNSNTEELCRAVKSLGGVCDLCESNLCNGPPEDKAVGPTRCYTCDGQCPEVLTEDQVQICDDVLGPGTDRLCFTFNYEADNDSLSSATTYKGCLEDDNVVTLACLLMNLTPGQTCQICRTELCNGFKTNMNMVVLDDQIINSPLTCYKCQDNNCEEPEESTCDFEDSVCYSYLLVSPDRTTRSRGCTFRDSDLGRYCTEMNDTSNQGCSICTEDLCNNALIGEPTLPENEGGPLTPGPTSGPQKCYFCVNECSDPVEEHLCEDDLGPDVDAICASHELTLMGNRTTISRGCFAYGSDFILACSTINATPGQKCSTCTDDLCNTYVKPDPPKPPEDDDDEPIITPGTGPQKCYFCNSECSYPVEEHACADILGPGVDSACLSSEVIGDNVTIISRRCVALNPITALDCSTMNLTPGQRCSTCTNDLCNTYVKTAPPAEEPEDDKTITYPTKCYSCNDNTCETPEEFQCEEPESLCYTYQFPTPDDLGVTKISRGCTHVDSDFSHFCANMNASPGQSCNTCSEDLCNIGEPAVTPKPPEDDDEPIVIPGTGPQKCYFCDSVCLDPVEEHACTDILEQGVDSACLSYEIIGENATIIARGCVAFNPNMALDCNTINLIPGQSCSTCTNDLCNTYVKPAPPEEPEDDNTITYPMKCYSCNDNTCETPVEFQCEEPESLCYTYQFPTPDDLGLTTISRGCIHADSDFSRFCTNMNTSPGHSCNTCSEDLCNIDEPAVTPKPPEDDEEPIVTPGTGPQKCYFCEFECSDPVEEHVCAEYLGQGVDSACLTYDYIDENVTIISRGCVAYDTTLSLACLTMNFQPGQRCNTCRNDLCNTYVRPVPPPPQPTRCYKCNNDDECQSPQEHSCEEGPDSLCYSYQFIALEGNYTTISRGCTSPDSDFSRYCDNMNTTPGQICTTCTEDLCNLDDLTSTPPPDDPEDEPIAPGIGPKKCHVCDNDCPDPIGEHSCEDVLGPGVNSACLSYDYVTANSTIIIRSCIENEQLSSFVCLALNLEEGQRCNTCATDLCNVYDRPVVTITTPPSPPPNDDDEDDDNDDNGNGGGGGGGGGGGSSSRILLSKLLILMPIVFSIKQLF